MEKASADRQGEFARSCCRWCHITRVRYDTIPGDQTGWATTTDFPASATILQGVGAIPTPAEGRPRTLAGVDLALLDNLWSLPPPRPTRSSRTWSARLFTRILEIPDENRRDAQTQTTYIICPRVWDKIILPHTMGQNRPVSRATCGSRRVALLGPASLP